MKGFAGGFRETLNIEHGTLNAEGGRGNIQHRTSNEAGKWDGGGLGDQ